MQKTAKPILVFLFSALLSACGSDTAAVNPNETEVITTLTLTFTPIGGGATITAAFDDPDGDGGSAPTIDPIVLDDGVDYSLDVAFANKLATPPEDITAEVEEESAQHQVFFTGASVTGPASDGSSALVEQSYVDTDANGHPVGLTNTINTLGTGSGTLTVTLRHLPPVNDIPVKTAGLAADVKQGGIAALPGETDATATFALTVQ